jgi:hypothetical protein
VLAEDLADILGQGMELHPGIETLRVLPEDHKVNIVSIIKGVARIRLAGPDVGM